MWSVGLLCAAVPLPAQVLPAGWRTAPGTAADVERTYEATGLPPGQFLRVEQTVLRPLAGATIDAWLSAAIVDDAAPAGAWFPPSRPGNVVESMMATITREYQSPMGVRGGRIYLGVAGGESQARVVRLTFSSAAVLRASQGAAAKELMSTLAQASLAGRRASRASSTDGAGSPIAGEARRAVAPSRNGFRAGGAIVPGRYVGDMVNDEGRVIVRYDVTLFANGEYAAPSGDNLLDSTGTYRYVATTGRLDIDGKLVNSRYDPDQDFCLYGRDAGGGAAIYVEDYYGIGTFRALLRRVSDPTRDMPSVVQAARKAAAAEAARYRFVTAPGAGLQPSQIEAVFYEWRQELEIGGLQFKEALYVLLTDGTVRSGMPVPPQDLDVAASRRGEPGAWGRWRRAGTTYEFAFGADRAFARKQGYVVHPARAGLSLQGRYEGNSHYEIPGGAGAWSNFGVTFSAGQRFERFRSGGAGMSGGYGDTRVTTATVYDDDGAVGGVAGATVAGGSVRRTPDTGARRGTWRTEGYALILTYDNGTVERLPFVIEEKVPGRVEGVWLNGSLLSPPKK
ncbi:MAG: hypothetical protein IT355_00040 [Gemmatimonadaceae bacterium]|nr:hypothetical protein [Gemmatimonadaceae bacterium]